MDTFHYLSIDRAHVVGNYAYFLEQKKVLHKKRVQSHIWIVFTHVVSCYASFLEQKNFFYKRKDFSPTARLFNLFLYTNMAAVTSYDNDL